MGGVDEVLVRGSGGLQAGGVDLVEVVAVIAVVVVVGPVQDDRGGDPDGREAEPLDVVELVDQALEVAPEHGGVLVGRVAGLDVLAAAPVVARVPVVEAGGEDEVDGVLAGGSVPSGVPWAAAGGLSPVVAFAGAEAAEVLPAASIALTV